MLYFTRWKALAIIVTALVVCLCAVPNFFPEATVKTWPAWAQRRLVLGLDLQGGSYLLLEVDANSVRKDRLEAVREDARKVLREARIGYTGLNVRNDAVEVRISKDTDVQTAISKLRDMSQPIRIVERRVNELGTVEPIIQRQGTDRILVQVPGLQDPTRLKELLGKTAKMEFRMVDDSVSPDQVAQGRAPPDTEVLPSATRGEASVVVKKQVLVSGGDLTDAQP